MQNITSDNFLLLKQNPSSKAIISADSTFTFGELKQNVIDSASSLKKLGVSAEECVGILSHNNIDFAVNVLALWQLSAIPVPINIRLTEPEIEEQLSSAKCQFVIVQDEFKNKIKNTKRKIIDGPFGISNNQTFVSKKEVHLKNTAVIIFTSGSTDKAKGVILTFESLFNSVVNSNYVLSFTENDCCLASLPFYHIGGFSIITRSILNGITLIIPESLRIEKLSKSIFKLKPTIISFVASQLKYFSDKGSSPNPELKNCLLGGGFSDNELVKNAVRLGWPVTKVYGSTETVSFVTALSADEINFKPDSAGRPVPPNKIFIQNSEGKDLKPFETGEIVIRSNSLMSSYLDAIETKNVLKDDYYYSGDLGYLDDEGYLFIEGRKNYLISTGGENVNPLDVENALLHHPMISDAAVFPLKDIQWGEIVCASVVLKEKAGIVTYDQLKIFLKNKIAEFKIPKKIFFEDSLPKTNLGKVEKEKLIRRHSLTPF